MTDKEIAKNLLLNNSCENCDVLYSNLRTFTNVLERRLKERGCEGSMVIGGSSIFWNPPINLICEKWKMRQKL